MPNIQRIIDKKLHANAAIAIQESAYSFSDALILESKTLAALEGADEVQTVHVERARDLVFSSTRNKNHIREVMLFVGSLLLGLSLQGFFQEYSSATPRVGWMAVYAAIGIFATVVSVAAFFKR